MEASGKCHPRVGGIRATSPDAFGIRLHSLLPDPAPGTSTQRGLAYFLVRFYFDWHPAAQAPDGTEGVLPLAARHRLHEASADNKLNAATTSMCAMYQFCRLPPLPTITPCNSFSESYRCGWPASLPAKAMQETNCLPPQSILVENHCSDVAHVVEWGPACDQPLHENAHVFPRLCGGCIIPAFQPSVHAAGSQFPILRMAAACRLAQGSE